MRLLSVVVVVLATFLFNSCSDSSSPEEPQDPKVFTLVSLDQDSVYWGDTVIAMFSNAKSLGLVLFLDTIPVQLDSLWRDAAGSGGLRFIVPVNSHSGAVRIFEEDSVAEGDRSLVVLPKLRSSINSVAHYFIPKKVYRGDILDIKGDDLPMRWRDMHVSVDGVLLPIVAWTRDHIFARTTSEVETGELSVRLFNKTTKVGTLEILEPTGSFLSEGRISSVLVNVNALNGTTHYMQLAQGDTFYTDMEGIQDQRIADMTFASVTPVSSSDSLIYLAEQIEGDYRYGLELRLKPEPGNRVSGKIISTFNHTSEDYWARTEMTIKDLRWVVEDGIYKLYSRSTDVADQLITFTQFVNSYSHTRTWLSYEGAKPDALLIIELTP